MIIDSLKNHSLYAAIHKNFAPAFAFIQKAVADDLPVGKYVVDGDDLYASVQAYTTKLEADGKFEGHQNYIDIQYIVSGIETVGVVDIEKAVSKTAYNPEKDVEFYEDSPKASTAVLEAGEYGIFFPHDIHKPGLCYENNPAPVKKIVVKIKV